jgi:hypothetical protein
LTTPVQRDTTKETIMSRIFNGQIKSKQHNS